MVKIPVLWTVRMCH